MSTRESLRDQLALLEKAHSTRFEDDEDWWVWFVTKKLGLPLPYERAVRKAVDETPWRNKKSPIGYVKRAAKYIARDDLGLADPDDRLALVLATDLRLRDDDGRWENAEDTLDRLHQAWEDSLPRELTDPLVPQGSRAAYVADRIGRLLADLGLGEHDPLRGYIVDRMFGFSFSHPTETTRKRFQRMRGRIGQAVLRIASEYEPDYGDE